MKGGEGLIGLPVRFFFFISTTSNYKGPIKESKSFENDHLVI